MAGGRIPGPYAQLERPQLVNDGTMPRLQHSRAGAQGTGATHPDIPDPYEAQLRELGLDLMQMAFDLAGFVDPTPTSDGVSAIISLTRGQWLDAVISGVSVIPYIGDLAKAGKLPKYLKTVERAFELADKSRKAALQILPGMQKLEELLRLVPAGTNEFIDQMRVRVNRFLAKHGAAVIADALPDISHRFVFKSLERDGKVYKEAAGRLGIPGKVKIHRSQTSQRGVSAGTGDDAGHLIGARFGAPGTKENLSTQNWIANRYGTYKEVENEWAYKLRHGIGIDVKVTDVFRKGEDRPFMRHVEWVETGLSGEHTTRKLDFANTHTPKSRDARGIEPSVTEPQKDNVIEVDFQNKQRKPGPESP